MSLNLSETSASRSSHAANAAAGSSSNAPSLLERIRALDRSAELSHRYIPLILYHPCPDADGDSPDDSPSYVAVGHAETSFVDSTLLHCKNEEGDPVFSKGSLRNDSGVMTDVLRLHMDLQTEKSTRQQRKGDCDARSNAELFHKRTSAFEHVTDHLISAGVISRKHDDLYPICPFVAKPSTVGGSGGRKHEEQEVLAHVNRNTAPYLGIDSVGVHLHCYVCRHDEPGGGDSFGSKKKPPVGLWLQKRAPNKAHHPNCWDPTAAGGHPAGMSLIDNVAKEAREEAGVSSEWVRIESSNVTNPPEVLFSDHTQDPLTITTAKPDGTCLKRSLYYSCDLRVPHDWTPIPVDGEVSEFKLYSMQELEEELRFGNRVRPAMRAVLLDFMMRHGALKDEKNFDELRSTMRRERMVLW